MDIFNFVKSRIAMLDVAQQYATLKKAGIYWKGNCPFHHERTGSFTVSPHREIFYCFGCHAGGDVIAFIAKAETLSPLEAVHFLIERNNLEVPTDILKQRPEKTVQEKDRYYTTCNLVALWCSEQLKQAKPALTYLQQRAINTASIDEFSLGYFPAGNIKNLLSYAKKQKLLAQDLLDAHILLEGKHELYSPFEDRIMFPIKDHIGRFCGFGGRTFKPRDDRPKYYNSHDHALFNKSSILFGLHHAKPHMHKAETVFLVEGYLDCIALAQAGFKNAVATLGTACTLEHLRTLSRFVQRIFVIYDGDKAGQNAILRLTQLCWQVDLELYVVQLPAQEDPASFLQNGGNMQLRIEEAQDIFLFFINQVSTNFTAKGLHTRLTTIRQVLELVGNVESRLKQEILLQKASQAFDIPLATLRQELGNSSKKPSTIISEQPKKAIKTSREITLLEKKMLSVILFHNNMVTSDDELLLLHTLSEPLVRLLQQVIFFRTEQGKFDFHEFFTSCTQQQQQALSRLLIDIDEQQVSIEYPYLLAQLHKKQWKSLVNDVKIKLAHAQQQGNIEEVQKILTDFKDVQRALTKRGLGL